MYFSWEDYVRNSAQYAPMVLQMENEVVSFMNNFHDDVRFISGWGHAYFCPEDGGRLHYDLTKPFSHVCTICGKEYSGYTYNACHVTMMRNEAVVTSLKAALLFKITGKDQYRQICLSIITYYAENYAQFCLHAKNMIDCAPDADVGGAGKIMPQGLNEAIIAIRMINALEVIKNDVNPAVLNMFKEKLFTPIYKLLAPQKNHIHNIPVWINSAIGVMGFFFNDSSWIEEATNAEFGLCAQLEKGVTASGFWYEGSIHYNFFALEGLMNYFVFAHEYGYDIGEKYRRIIFGMLDAAYHYAFDNDVFPNPGDGWPDVSLKTYSHIYYTAYHVFGGEVVPYILHIEKNNLQRARLPLSEPYYYNNEIPLTRIMFAPHLEDSSITAGTLAPRVSSCFESSSCALLRSDVFNVYFKYGHRTRSHAHPDKMNIEIAAHGRMLTRDLSNSGYASKMCNIWHRTIAAHSTVAVDGLASDCESPGTLISYTQTSVKAIARAYDGVEYTRSISLEGNTLHDSFTVKTEKQSVIDWFFHWEHPVDRSSLTLQPVSMFGEYGPIMDVREIIIPKDENGSRTLVLENKLASMTVRLEPGTAAYLVKTYANPADRMRDTLILRKAGTNAQFDAVISV